MILNFLYNGIMGLNGDLQKGIYVLDEFTQEITFHAQELKPLSDEVRAAFDVITTGVNAENMIGSDCFIVGVNHKFYASVKYALQEYEIIMTEQMQSSGILNPTFVETPKDEAKYKLNDLIIFNENIHY